VAFFLALSPQTSGDFMSGFLCFSVAEPTGKELEKNVSIVPKKEDSYNCDEQGVLTNCHVWNT
jgi:hypothetical protein